MMKILNKLYTYVFGPSNRSESSSTDADTDKVARKSLNSQKTTPPDSLQKTHAFENLTTTNKPILQRIRNAVAWAFPYFFSQFEITSLKDIPVMTKSNSYFFTNPLSAGPTPPINPSIEALEMLTKSDDLLYEIINDQNVPKTFNRDRPVLPMTICSHETNDAAAIEKIYQEFTNKNIKEAGIFAALTIIQQGIMANPISTLLLCCCVEETKITLANRKQITAAFNESTQSLDIEIQMFIFDAERVENEDNVVIPKGFIQFTRKIQIPIVELRKTQIKKETKVLFEGASAPTNKYEFTYVPQNITATDTWKAYTALHNSNKISAADFEAPPLKSPDPLLDSAIMGKD